MLYLKQEEIFVCVKVLLLSIYSILINPLTNQKTLFPLSLHLTELESKSVENIIFSLAIFILQAEGGTDMFKSVAEHRLCYLLFAVFIHCIQGKSPDAVDPGHMPLYS